MHHLPPELALAPEVSGSGNGPTLYLVSLRRNLGISLHFSHQILSLHLHIALHLQQVKSADP